MMSKRILYIDLFSSDGHLNFNRIYIKGLMKENVSLTCSFREKYLEKLKIRNDIDVLIIPERFFVTTNGWLSRYYLIKMMSYIKRKLVFDRFDKIIIAGYDEIALYFSFIKTRMFLINHNNIQGLDNKIKHYFFKKISKNNTHIVFEDYMKQSLKERNINNVFRISHGLPSPMLVSKSEIEKTFFKTLNNTKNFKTVLFSPSKSSTDQSFMNKLLNDEDFNFFLKEEKILFILKGNYNFVDTPNIKIIRRFLTVLEYNSLFLKSDIILINYPNSFKLRVSAILLECFANQKMCIFSDIEAFKVYKKYIKYKPSYKDIYSLRKKITEIVAFSSVPTSLIFTNLNNLNPDFTELLN